MSTTRKGPVSMFWTGTLEAKLTAATRENERLQKDRDAKVAQIISLRRALATSVRKERRVRERLQGHITKQGAEMNRDYQSMLSPEPDMNGRYYGFYRYHRMEVEPRGVYHVAFVDGKEIGAYDSRNLAETHARIEIDKRELCEIDG